MPAVALARAPLVADRPIYISLQRLSGVPVVAEELDIYKATRAKQMVSPLRDRCWQPFHPMTCLVFMQTSRLSSRRCANGSR